MRAFVQVCYRVLLKGTGAIGLLMCCVYAMTLTGGIDTDDAMYPLPQISFGVLTLTSLLVSVFLERLPRSFACPNRPWHVAIVLPATALLSVVAALTIIIMVSEIGFGDGIQRPLAVNTASIMVLLYGLAALTGMLLSVWAEPADHPA